MMDSTDFLADEKECAKMLDMTLQEYRTYLKTVKVPKKSNVKKKSDYNDTFLKKMGLTEEILKTVR